MKIFEFHFNPSGQEDLVFDSFCYEPASSREAGLGNLYIVGELQNVIPQNSRLVNNLALLLKKEYYLAVSPEQGIKKALKKANDFLSDRSKTGNISWLGNLSLAVVSIHDLELNFSKDGKIKMLLLRPNQITDIGRNFEIEEFEPYPLKIFTNIINGKFLENDKILILTSEVFEIFSRNSLLEKLSLLQDPKAIKEFFKNREKEFSEIAGICFLIFLSKENLPKSVLTLKKTVAPLSLREIFAPLYPLIGQVKKLFVVKNKPKKAIKFHYFKKLSPPRLKFPLQFKNEKNKKNVLLILSFVALIIIGILFSRHETANRLAQSRAQLIAAQEKIVQAQSYLALGQNARADQLFKEIYETIALLANNNSLVKEQASSLKALVEKNLNELNKIEEIPEPELIFNFSDKGLAPQHLILYNNDLYFFSSLQKGIAKLAGQDLQKIQTNGNFSLAASSSQGLVLFSRPNQLSVIVNDQIQTTASLELLSQNEFISMISFNDNLYFLEKDSGQIVKYREPFWENTHQPNYWIKPQEKRALGAESFKVTGSVYILNKDNAIWRYQDGVFNKSLPASVFPFPKSFLKLVYFPSFPGFAILEPVEKRIILIDSQGTVLKQFRSDKFTNLKDAVFSADGKFLYVLSGAEVYRLSL